MALIFERIQSEGIASLSYLIGDDEEGVAAVIDPTTDVAKYLKLARQQKVAITHAFETHIHADFVSGSRELMAQNGAGEICASVEGGAKYGFPVTGVKHGDTFTLGSLRLTARLTPGHTPEHMSYELGSEENGDVHSVFTGDSLFVNSAGRPDLLGKDADKLAAQLYETVHGYFGGLADGIIIHPSHGSGSPCGADIGERLESTIGYEKAHNPYFQLKEKGEFVKRALESAPPEPTYYKRMKRVNAAGPEVLGRLPVVPALPIGQFSKEVESGESVLVDTRHMLAFGGGHISGALSIGANPMLTIWAGWLLDPGRSILLVLEKDSAVEEVTALFVRAGFTEFAGYLAGGMTTWDNKGHPLERLPQMTVHEVKTCSNDLQVVDVRTPQERAKGHIPCSRHLFVPEIADKSGSLRKDQPVVTYCASGYRASIAASILQAEGFSDVRTMPGSWKAWQAAGLPVSTEETAP